MPDKSKVDWNIELNFEVPSAEKKPPPVPAIPPREILKQKAPWLLEQIDMDWCTRKLHHDLEQILFGNRNGQDMLAPDVIAALGQIHSEHRRMLIINGLLHPDVRDKQFGDK